MRLALVSALFLPLAACDQKPAPSSPVPIQSPVPYQRFIPMPRQPENVQGVPWSGAFALDTRTGQLCLTYEGDVGKDWQSLPTCLALFNQYPTDSPKDPLGILK